MILKLKPNWVLLECSVFLLAPWAEFWSQFSRLVQMLRVTWIRNVNTSELFAEISWLHQNPHKASLSSGCSLLNPPLMQPALSRSGPTHLWTASVRGRGKKKRSFSFSPSLPPSFLPSLLSIKCSVSGASRLRLSLSNEEKGALLRSLGCTNLRLFSTGIIFCIFLLKK